MSTPSQDAQQSLPPQVGGEDRDGGGGTTTPASASGHPPLALPRRMPSVAKQETHPDRSAAADRPSPPARHRPIPSSAATAKQLKKRHTSIAASLAVATFTLWALTTLTALALGVVADVFQADPALFPLEPVLGTSIGLNAVAAALVMLLGKLTKKGFAVFQPFSGGQTFALMQAAAYTLAVFSALGMVVLMQSLPEPAAADGTVRTRYGVYTVLSGFSGFAQVLLAASLLFFQSPRRSATTGAAAAGAAFSGSRAQREKPHLSLWDITVSPAREYAFIAVCCSVMIVSATLAEVYPAYRTVSVLIVACFTGAALATVSHLGRHFAPTYRMLLPTSQVLSLTALQLLGNALLLLSACGGLVLHTAGQKSPPSWHLGVALVGVTAICCHQLLLRLTQSREKEAVAAASALADAAANPTSPLIREFANAQAMQSLGSFNAAVMATGVSLVLAVAIFAIGVFVSFHLASAESRTREAIRDIRDGGDGGGTYVVQGFLQVQALLVVLLFAMPPFTHLQGRLVFGNGYEIWQPFKGSVEFVILQAAAWASYAFAILFGTLQLSEPAGSFNFLLLLTTALLLSQLFVHVSLHLFDENKRSSLFSTPARPAESEQPLASERPREGGLSEEEEEEEPRQASLGDASPSSTSAAFPPSASSASFSSPSSSVPGAISVRSLVEVVVNGELLLSLVLCIVSLLIRCVCDTVEQRRTTSTRTSSLRVPVEELMMAANVLSFVATPVAQLSMRDRVPLMHLASTSSGFNVLQTVAWLVYLTLLFIAVVDAVMKWDHFFMSTAGHQLMQHTAQGLLLAVPLVCVVISDFCVAQERLMESATTARVRRAADALAQLLDMERRSGPEQRRVIELIRTIAGPRLTATDWGVAVVSAAAAEGEGDAAAAAGAADRPRASGLLDEAERERRQADVEASVTAARYITAIMCLACTAAFASAAFLADAQPVMTLLFGVAGVLVLSLSCVSLQLVLGYRLHAKTGRFAVFMPFVGGRPFVLWQALGWTCYTVVVCLIIACVVEGRGSRFVFFVMSVLSVVAETAIFHSILLFNAEASAVGTGFVGRNAEGILAAVIILGSFSFARAYDMACEGSVSSHASALVPLVITSIAMCLTVPMGLLSLQRQAVHYGASPFAFLDSVSDSDDSEEEVESDEVGSERCTVRAAAADLSRAATTGAGEVGADAAGMSLSRKTSELWPASAPMSPATREGLIRHARHESFASPLCSTGTPTAGAIAHGRHASFTTTTTPGSPSSSLTSRTALDAHDALPREASAFPSRNARRRGGRRRAGNYTIAISYAVSLLIALFLALLLPFAAVFLAYSCMHETRQLTYAAGTRALEVLVAGFMVVVTVPMVVGPIARRSRAVRWVHSALCAWAIYSVPTITVLSGVSPPFLVHSRGAWLFGINMCSMACLSTVPYVHLLAFIFSVLCCGYFAQFHLYDCLYQHKQPFVLWKCIFDMTCALFWLWYGRRFVGRPEVTGRYQSNKASRFFQTHFFESMAHWFSLRVVLAELYLLPSEKDLVTLVSAESPAPFAAAEDEQSAGLRSLTHRHHVNRSSSASQYLFSFHPHGVFPGTALYAPLTSAFQRAVGTNSTNYVSTHCADVVFSVPLMRELPLCLGAISVSRAGIEHSIKAANSPLIVTGGQSEMLLVRMSATEMHLVCHHLGFIKIALRHKIPLVPVLSFSECNIMDNVHCLKVQRWFLKRIGFPFPTLPHGFMKLPLPTNTPMTMIIGPPLMPLPGRDNWEDPACQEEMRVRYFSHLEYLFYRYRATAGYPDMKLYLHYGVDDEGVLATPPPPGMDVATAYVLDEENAAIRRSIAANLRNREARALKKTLGDEEERRQVEKRSPE